MLWANGFSLFSLFSLSFLDAFMHSQNHGPTYFFWRILCIILYAHNFCLRIENEDSIFDESPLKVSWRYFCDLSSKTIVLNKLIAKLVNVPCNGIVVMNKTMHIYFSLNPYSPTYRVFLRFSLSPSLQLLLIPSFLLLSSPTTTTITFNEQNFQHFSHLFYCNREFM